MIVNLDQLNAVQKNTWKALAAELEALGFNLKVFSGSRHAVVSRKESEEEVGRVSTEMVEDEEISYILRFRLNLTGQ